MNHRKQSTDGIDALGEYIAEAYRQGLNKIPDHLKPPYCARIPKASVSPSHSDRVYWLNQGTFGGSPHQTRNTAQDPRAHPHQSREQTTMLTIKKIKVERGLEASIAVTPDMNELDRARLGRLANVFYGHHTTKPEAYVFTEARGRKCWDLYSAGFDAKAHYAKSDRMCIVHPAINRSSSKSELRPLRVPEAMALIPVVTALPVVAVEEWA